MNIFQSLKTKQGRDFVQWWHNDDGVREITLFGVACFSENVKVRSFFAFYFWEKKFKILNVEGKIFTQHYTQY